MMGTKAESDAVAAVAKDLDRIRFLNASCNFITEKASSHLNVKEGLSKTLNEDHEESETKG